MNALPVIVRELRSESRRPLNYWLRVGIAGVALVVFAWLLGDQEGTAAQVGAQLFFSLNTAMIAAIALVAPLLTAECISRERREGTLGLLFLTPLKPRDIVVGKSLSQMLRAGNVFLAILPMIALPFLLGGIAWQTLTIAALFDCSLLLVALGIGLVASAFSRDLARSLMAAEGAGLLAGWLLLALNAAGVSLLMNVNQPGGRFWADNPASTGDLMAFARWSLTQFSDAAFGGGSHGLVPSVSLEVAGGGVFHMSRLPAVLTDLWLLWSVVAVGLAALFLLAAIRLVAWRIRRSWQDEPPSKTQHWLLATFCTPRLWRGVFRGRMTRLLDRNPIGWLQQYRWSARLAKWSWCLFIVIAECVLIADPYPDGMIEGQYWLAGFLLLGLSFSAAGSFRPERENGSMELLLVTPLTEIQIIMGRLCGVWRQFLPSMGLLAFAWVGLIWQFGDWVDAADNLRQPVFPMLVGSNYVALPLVGLAFSFRKFNFLASWALTLAVGLVLPAALAAIFSANTSTEPATNFAWFYTILQLGAFGTCAQLLYWSLRRRTFAAASA